MPLPTLTGVPLWAQQGDSADNKAIISHSQLGYMLVYGANKLLKQNKNKNKKKLFCYCLGPPDFLPVTRDNLAPVKMELNTFLQWLRYGCAELVITVSFCVCTSNRCSAFMSWSAARTLGWQLLLFCLFVCFPDLFNYYKNKYSG